MATTKIGWTNRVWNPTTGCDQISPGCTNCYALTMAGRLKLMGQAKYQNDGDPRTSGPGFGLTVHPDTLDAPLHWRKPSLVFVNSMSDLFHDDVPVEFIAKVYATMVCSADVIKFQVLTKRPHRMARLLADERFQQLVQREVWALDGHMFAGFIRPNIWWGVSIESDRYTFRARHLVETPAAVRWLSLEPLLGPLPSLDLAGIDWVVVGGESGPRFRTMDVGWLADIAAQCDDLAVPLFVKQDSHRHSEQQGRIPDDLWARKEFPRA